MNIILIEADETFFESSDERAQHIRKVLKLSKGDTFRCGVINSYEGKAVIIEDNREGITFAFTPLQDTSSLYPLTLIVGQTRPICMRRILREAVSLGVGRIILPITDLGEKSYSSSSLYRDGEYRKILLDGAMQAGATGVSECIIAESTEDAVSAARGDILLLLDNVIGAGKLSEMDLKGKSVTLAIGPERGWSGRERELFISSGYIPSLIGNRILRTETAVPAAVSLALSGMKLI